MRMGNAAGLEIPLHAGLSVDEYIIKKYGTRQRTELKKSRSGRK